MITYRVQGNTSNIVFLKSTDDSMIDTLQKMSGTTHKVFKEQKTVTRDLEKLFLKNEGKVAYVFQNKEIPVISYNDLCFISDRNSIVFRAGDSPIWNRNETVLPMSWRLYKDTIIQPGKEFSLQTIPTLSSAIDFDIRRNQPDFDKMFNKRIAQATEASHAKQLYQDVFGYSDYEIEQLDPDNYADEIMEVINALIRDKKVESDLARNAETNDEQMRATNAEKAKREKEDKKIFARGLIAPSDLWQNGRGIGSLDELLIAAYKECRGDMEQDTSNFKVVNGSIYDVTGLRPYILRQDNSQDLQTMQKASEDPKSRVYSDGQANELKNIATYIITDDFRRFLASRQAWDFAKGRFDTAVARLFDS